MNRELKSEMKMGIKSEIKMKMKNPACPILNLTLNLNPL